jgi:acetyltransferase-like isoleucine patch superfamily enzyme
MVSAFFLLLGSSFYRLLDILTTFFVSSNLKSVGRNVHINCGFTYRYPGNIEIGNNVSVARGVTLISENKNGHLTIEDNVVITFDVRIDFSGSVFIGKNTLISKNTIIETHDHGLDPFAEPEYKDLAIGENVWIGMNATIMSDVRSIGSNSIIAAGSIVTKAVPSNCIVGGIPAKIIKHR